MRKLIGFVVGLSLFAFAFEASAKEEYLPSSVAGFQFGQKRNKVIETCNVLYYVVDTETGAEFCMRTAAYMPFKIIGIEFRYTSKDNKLSGIHVYSETSFYTGKASFERKYGKANCKDGFCNWRLKDGVIILSPHKNPYAGFSVSYFDSTFFTESKDNW